jgi:hypothetical protein
VNDSPPPKIFSSYDNSKLAAKLRLKSSASRTKENGVGEASVFERAYLVRLVQEIIGQGVIMGHADSHGHYAEIDTQEDFELAQTQWKIP